LATSYRFEYGKSISYGSSVPTIPGSLAAGFEDAVVSVPLSGLAYETTYHFRAVATNSEATSYGSDRTFTTTGVPSYLSSFGSIGTGNGQFKNPQAMVADSAGNVYVVDRNNNRVEKFNAKGEYLSQFGTPGAGNGQLNDPRAITLTGNGKSLWVADAGNHRIQKFSTGGEYQSQIKQGLQSPSGLAIGRDGNSLFVSDQGVGQVKEFRTNVLTSEGYPVKEWLGFATPSQMVADPEGVVWLVDQGQNRVYEFPASLEAAPVSRFGTTGSGPGQLSAPYGIAVKPSGNLLVSDRGNNRIEQFSPKGGFQQQFGTVGSGPGQFSEPSGVAIGLDGSAFIADAANNRIQKWIFK
jgi:DNA-binding beta-propeller fold protein YncE